MSVFRLEMCLSSAEFDAPLALRIEASDLNQAIEKAEASLTSSNLHADVRTALLWDDRSALVWSRRLTSPHRALASKRGVWALLAGSPVAT